MNRSAVTGLRWLGLTLGALMLARDAHAHLMNTGLGPFYDGILHLLVTPVDLLPLLAMSLYAGQRGAAPGRTTLFSLPVAWFAGGLIGLRVSAEFSLPVITTLILVGIGVLVAADARFSRVGVGALAVGIGLLHGILNGSAMAEAGAGLRGLLGIALTAFVIVALVSAFVVSLREGWPRIVIRVAGSWIAAIALLMLGWTLR